VEVHPIAAFIKTTVQVYVIRPDGTVCDAAPGRPLTETFRALFVCRKLALAVEVSNRWSVAHRRALAGWFIANYNLYTRISPVSPYGFDSELLSKLDEILMAVDVERKYRDADFAPLRLADVRAAKKLIDEEPIRLAGAVGTLLNRGEIKAAEAINKAASSKLQDLGPGLAIQGINKQLLDNNAALIRAYER
jgi:hypothetical protein